MMNFLLCLSASSVRRWVIVRLVKFGVRCCFSWIVCLSSFSKVVSLFSISIGAGGGYQPFSLTCICGMYGLVLLLLF